jgi:hypothetical protein
VTIQSVENDLWQELKAAVATPQAADLKRLCELLDWAIARLPESQQLAVAGEAIVQIAQVHTLRFDSLIEGWEETDPLLEEALPVLSLETIESWIRQSMSVDLDAFVEQPKSSRNREKLDCSPTDSVLAIVEPEVILQMVEEMEAHSESEQIIRQLAGEEDPARWSAAIVQWMRTNPSHSIQMTDLLRELGMPWVEIWLGLLLGEFELEPRGDFYTGEVFIRLSLS